jgi:hypothetical protein
VSRHFLLPSFRTRAVAAAGTLAVAIAAGAAAATIPGGASAAPAAPATATAYVTSVAGPHSTAGGTQAHPLSGAQLVIDGQQARFGLQHRIDVAAEQTADKAAAAKAAAAKAAEAKAAAAKAAAAKTAAAEPSGSPRQIAEQTLRQFGWPSSQFSCLDPLWEHESGWQVTAENPSSGAYGIPQALSGPLMASAGPHWQTDAATQIRWGLTYIQGRYGSPCGAWAHEQADNWY